jgi:hypothetical protein
MASSSTEVKKGDVSMLATHVPASLRERLGAEGTSGLIQILERTRDESVTTALAACTDRFERRLTETNAALQRETAGLRLEMHDGFAAVRQEMRDGFALVRQEMHQSVAAVRQEMHDGVASVRLELATQRAELLKWSFLFWIGQVAVVAGVLGVLLRVMTP